MGRRHRKARRAQLCQLCRRAMHSRSGCTRTAGKAMPDMDRAVHSGYAEATTCTALPAMLLRDSQLTRLYTTECHSRSSCAAKGTHDVHSSSWACLRALHCRVCCERSAHAWLGKVCLATWLVLVNDAGWADSPRHLRSPSQRLGSPWKLLGSTHATCGSLQKLRCVSGTAQEAIRSIREAPRQPQDASPNQSIALPVRAGQGWRYVCFGEWPL